MVTVDGTVVYFAMKQMYSTYNVGKKKYKHVSVATQSVKHFTSVVMSTTCLLGLLRLLRMRVVEP